VALHPTEPCLKDQHAHCILESCTKQHNSTGQARTALAGSASR
jgi:hypothetical protein